jgi:hypothetical protein
MTVVAIVLGFAVTIKGLVPMIIASLVWCVMPTPFVICAIFARGDVRAFAIGGLVPWLPLLRGVLPSHPPFLIPVWLLIMTVICGVVAVATYRRIRNQS